VTQLKIDMEFIREIGTDAADRRVVESMIDVARNFEMTTVAEGVEDEQTLALLRELGVDLVQGYLIGRPRQLASESGRDRGLEQRELDRDQSLLDLEEAMDREPS
jgi:EAL domain-containing protein (putative c-di-GMP-specific phosphodiesterase class I)